MQPAAMHGLYATLSTAGVATVYQDGVKGQRRYEVWMDEDNEIEQIGDVRGYKKQLALDAWNV